MAEAITDNDHLQNLGTSATASGATVTITSLSSTPNGTTYDVSITGSETFVLSSTGQGNGNSLTTIFKGDNQEVLQNAWNYIYVNTQNRELFAEETAQISGNSSPPPYSPDYWLGLDPGFWCTTRVVFTLEAYGTVPEPGDYGPKQCGTP